MIEWVKTQLRTRLPARIYGPIRARRVRGLVSRYEPRSADHEYAGFPLRVLLEDPLAEGWYDHDWDEPAEITELRRGRLRPGARVLDVGAHQGIVGLILARIVGPEGLVVAVEAEPHNAAVARRNAAVNNARNVTVVHAAVGARNGVLSFREGLNGSVVRDATPGAVEVRSLTVDELAERHGLPDVVLVDVEGYEAHVLAGATRTIEAGATDFFVELHSAEMLQAAGSTPDEVLGHFLDGPFEVVVAPVDETPPGVGGAGAWRPADPGLYRRGRRCFVVARPLVTT